MRELVLLVVGSLLLGIAVAGAIVHLDNKNFQERINAAPFTFVYVYSSTCGYCKEFTPKFQKLANSTELNELNIAFAKMDGPMYSNLSQSLEAFSYPSLLFFQKNILFPVLYRKEREIKNIVQFLKKITKPSYEPQLLKHIVKMTPQYIVNAKLALFHGKKDSLDFQAWDMAMKRDGYISWTFQQSQETKVVIGENVITQFKDFQKLEREIKRIYASLLSITEQSWLKMMERKQFTIFYVNKHGNRKTEELLSRLSKEFSQILFISVDGQHEQYKSALRSIGINDDENIVAVHKLHDAIYMAPSPYTESGLREFINKAREYKLQLYRKTEKTDKINKLTRTNYEERMSTNQDVLMFIYDRKDQISKELMSLFEFLLLKLKKNEGLLLLRCDVGLNEIQEKLGYLAKPLPKIVYYRNKMKQTHHALFFTGYTISAETILQFIQENATFDFQSSAEL